MHLFYKQACFRPQAEIYFSGFFVAGSKYAHSMFISKHAKFCYVAQ